MIARIVLAPGGSLSHVLVRRMVQFTASTAPGGAVKLRDGVGTSRPIGLDFISIRARILINVAAELLS